MNDSLSNQKGLSVLGALIFAGLFILSQLGFMALMEAQNRQEGAITSVSELDGEQFLAMTSSKECNTAILTISENTDGQSLVDSELVRCNGTKLEIEKSVNPDQISILLNGSSDPET